jgi:thiol-disulfide isomerase/thioredoxin
MMLRLTLACLIFLAAAFSPLSAQAGDPAADLKALVAKISAKIRTSERTAAALAPELAEFDALLAKYQGQKTDDVAQIALMHAMLYAQVINDETTARKLLATLQEKFPGTKQAESVTRILASMDQAGESKAKLAALTGKPAPSLHFNWSSRPGLKTLADLKGQVVVLDFWATWCGPCISSFPTVREHVAHFKGSPVTFLGVTSIQGFVSNLEPGRIETKGDPQKEMGLMPAFMKAKEMTWDVVFSEEKVFNPEYGIQGIPYIAILAPDGTVRHAGMNPHDPNARIVEKVTALLEEFKLPLPGKKS